LRAALERVMLEPELRTRCVREGQVAAAALTWDRCARATAAVYAEALEGTC
jgi:glycosyltransferase involved in cell wall biosynthesis